jgi:hypothetical protein
MNLTGQIAKQLREVHFGGNWTSSSVKENLADISWQEAITRVHTYHTIASLVFHMNYYVHAVLKVLEGNVLDAHDKFSFDLPSVKSQQDWDLLLSKTWTDAENLAVLIETLPETTLWEVFSDRKYGNYYRNILGVIEHIHYHLGQIVLIKKFLREK